MECKDIFVISKSVPLPPQRKAIPKTKAERILEYFSKYSQHGGRVPRASPKVSFTEKKYPKNYFL